MIINYKDFLTYNSDMLRETKDSSNYKYGCVMIYLKIDNWNEITSKIEKDDVYGKNGDITKGLEQYPHVTALYGLKDTVTENDVKNIIDKYKNNPFNIRISGIGIFENDEFDVVKMNVESDILHKLNTDLKQFPYVSDYPNYRPHVTIAFVKKGSGSKYIDKNYKAKLDNNIKYVLFTKPDGSEHKFDLK